MLNHNIEKITALNNSVSKYYYSIAGRNYIHASTIATAVYDIISAKEVTVNLRKIVTTGFVFNDTPTENDLGFVILDNTVLYLTATTDSISEVITMSESQHQLYMMASMSVSMLPLWGGQSKFWSRNLTVRPKWIIGRDFTKVSISTKITEDVENEDRCCIDMYIDEVLVWRQDVIKSGKTL